MQIARLVLETARSIVGRTIPLLLSMVLGEPARAEAAQPSNDLSAIVASSDVGRAVERKLKTDPHLEAAELTVSERNGIVELGGTVPLRSWRARAARVASVVRDVRGVVNRIRVVEVRRADQLVAADIRRALRATASLASMPIVVRVRKGVAELSGMIGTWEQQQLAERVALGVKGVRFCQNQLVGSRSMTRTAAMIADDVYSRLDWDPLVRHAPVRVTVRKGRIALKGTVGSQAERRRVIAHAWVKGVVAVEAQELVVDVVKRPDNDVRSTFPTDAEISVALRDLTPFWPTLSASSFSTTVVGGVVTLRGTVQTLAEKRAAEHMARSVVGVTEVKTELRGPWWRPPPPSQPPPTTPRRRVRRGR
jgi:osmotically-inducible protein OsmY